MWLRNLTFVAVCLVGVAAIGASLLRRDRIVDPPGFEPGVGESAEFQATVSAVNEEFHRSWQDDDGQYIIEIAKPADNLTLARRLSLGLTGTVPSLEEIRAFEKVAEDDQLRWWTARLLNDRRYADFVAERLARAYVGTEGGPFLVFRRRRFVSWLSDRLVESKPYDQIVRTIISDTGLWTDSPAVNFITVTQTEDKPDPIRLAGRTTRAFLGMRIDCLQCHDDRLGNVELGTADDPRDGLQSDFHKLAAFFGQCETSLLGITDGEQDYRYKYLDAEEETTIDPQPPFAEELIQAGETRRQTLARWVTHRDNKAFGRATVNRVWALLFGRPLVDPIDDIPLHGPYPPALESLADDFVAHDYDLRRLIRLIAASEVFRLDSRATFEVTEQHETKWSVFPLTRLRPEQVAGGLIQACALQTIDANANIFVQLGRFNQQNEFIQRYGDTGDDEFVDRGGTITQRLLMMNGNLVKERSKQDGLSNASGLIASLSADNEQAVEIAYLCVLSRRPTPQETQHFSDRLGDATGNRRAQIMEDLFWVLLNSTEFSWNH